MAGSIIRSDALIMGTPIMRWSAEERWFRNHYHPPVTAQQLQSVGKDPDCLYWSGTFYCWRLSGDWIRPYASTYRLLAELGLSINPEA